MKPLVSRKMEENVLVTVKSTPASLGVQNVCLGLQGAAGPTAGLTGSFVVPAIQSSSWGRALTSGRSLELREKSWPSAAQSCHQCLCEPWEEGG
jgi:hypothetical protein